MPRLSHAKYTKYTKVLSIPRYQDAKNTKTSANLPYFNNLKVKKEREDFTLDLLILTIIIIKLILISIDNRDYESL